jgi:hypothetical protein
MLAGSSAPRLCVFPHWRRGRMSDFRGAAHRTSHLNPTHHSSRSAWGRVGPSAHPCGYQRGVAGSADGARRMYACAMRRGGHRCQSQHSPFNCCHRNTRGTRGRHVHALRPCGEAETADAREGPTVNTPCKCKWEDDKRWWTAHLHFCPTPTNIPSRGSISGTLK